MTSHAAKKEEDLSSTFSTLAISPSHVDQPNPALCPRTQLNYIGALPIGSSITNPTPNTTPSRRDVLGAFPSPFPPPSPMFASPIVRRSVGLDFASFGVTTGPSYPGFGVGPEQSVSKPSHQLQHQQLVLKPNAPSKLNERSLQTRPFQSLFDPGVFYFGVKSVNVSDDNRIYLYFIFEYVQIKGRSLCTLGAGLSQPFNAPHNDILNSSFTAELNVQISNANKHPDSSSHAAFAHTCGLLCDTASGKHGAFNINSAHSPRAVLNETSGLRQAANHLGNGNGMGILQPSGGRLGVGVGNNTGSCPSCEEEEQEPYSCSPYANAKIAAVAVLRNQSRVQKPVVCVFCRKNGESEEFYRKHTLKDGNGKVQCPVLRRFKCPLCDATGENVCTLHSKPTRTY